MITFPETSNKKYSFPIYQKYLANIYSDKNIYRVFPDNDMKITLAIRNNNYCSIIKEHYHTLCIDFKYDIENDYYQAISKEEFDKCIAKIISEIEFIIK